jgi:hypothetical protein
VSSRSTTPRGAAGTCTLVVTRPVDRAHAGCTRVLGPETRPGRVEGTPHGRRAPLPGLGPPRPSSGLRMPTSYTASGCGWSIAAQGRPPSRRWRRPAITRRRATPMMPWPSRAGMSWTPPTARSSTGPSSPSWSGAGSRRGPRPRPGAGVTRPAPAHEAPTATGGSRPRTRSAGHRPLERHVPV